MDIQLLAEALTQMLAPALPYLVQGGQDLVADAGKALGTGAWEKGRWRPGPAGSPWDGMCTGMSSSAGSRSVSEPADPSREHEEIRNRLRGLLPDNQIEQMIEMLRAQESAVARVQGSGAIAEGMGALAGGAGSVVVGGNVGGNIVLSNETAATDPSALRSAYLSRLMEQVGDLSLTGIDPAAAGGEAEARLSLDAVYTALLTMSPAEDREGYRGFKGPEMERRRSALEQLDRHDRLVLLGDPGSGKSTFLNFVALCLAGEILGHSRANLELLRSPLSDEEDKNQPWGHGPLLPVRVVLRDFAARGLPSPEETASARHLWSFIEGTLAEGSLGEYAPALKKELQEKGGVLLFDGLDEVPEAESRRDRIRGLIRIGGSCCESPVWGLSRFPLESSSWGAIARETPRPIGGRLLSMRLTFQPTTWLGFR